MDHSEPDLDDDTQYAELLVEMQTELAEGNTTLDGLQERWSGVSTEIVERLETAKSCLLRMERIWPRAKTTKRETPKSVGRFEIVRELGCGGFGIVYLANDPSLSRAIALKVQRPEAILSPTLRRRFMREAKAAGSLRHPHIAAVHEVGENGLQVWIASEYCDAGSLAAWLHAKPTGVLPRSAAEFMATLADAVEYAHQNGILHRDLKPSNVLLDRAKTPESTPPASLEDLSTFVPKLIDFGLAKIEDNEQHETRSRALVGTPPYMAPEQAAGNLPCRPRYGQCHGLGTILYELLTGRAVFGGENDVQTLRRVIEDEPVRPRKLRPSLPVDLEAICLKCLEKAPHKRYPNAASMAADLRRFLSGQPTKARPIAPAERLIKWARRHPALAALLGVSTTAAAVIVCMTLVYITRLREANQAAEFSAADSRQHENEANQYLYASRMKLAYQLIDQGEVEQARGLLDYYEPGSPLADLRGFEWYHVKRRLHGERLSLAGHRGEVYGITFSPDGRQVVSGGEDGTIRFWDVETGHALKTIDAHKSCVNDVAYSPDGATLASASCDHTIRLWDATSLESLGTLDDSLAEVHCLAFCPTEPSRLAAGGHESLVRVWDLTTHKVVRSFDARSWVNGLAWRPDGKALFIAGGMASPNEPRSYTWNIEDDRATAHDWIGYSVAASSDGDACWGSVGATIHASADSGVSPVTLAGPADHVDAVAFSASGAMFATGGAYRTIHMRDAATNACIGLLAGHTERVQSLAFSSRGSTLASASHDGTVKLWNEEPMDRTVRTVDACFVGGSLRPLAISCDFCYLAVLGRHDEVYVYRLNDGSFVGSLPLTGFPRGCSSCPTAQFSQG